MWCRCFRKCEENALHIIESDYSFGDLHIISEVIYLGSLLRYMLERNRLLNIGALPFEWNWYSMKDGLCSSLTLSIIFVKISINNRLLIFSFFCFPVEKKESAKLMLSKTKFLVFFRSKCIWNSCRSTISCNLKANCDLTF